MLIGVACRYQCKLVESFSVGNCECVFVDIFRSGTGFIRYSVIYRPPDTCHEISVVLFNMLYELLKNVKHYVMMGDFNLPDICWTDFTAQSALSREFLTFCFKIGAFQVVNFPTRGENLIDLIFCSDRNYFKQVEPGMPFATSDHNSIMCKLSHFNVHDKIANFRPCFKKADYKLINSFLATIDWACVYNNCITIDDYWDSFKNIMNSIIFNFVPFVNTSKQGNKNKPWFDSKLSRLRSVK